MAALGESGLLDPVAPGIAVGSDTGHLALLGYNPREEYTGRGPFEARGIGMEVRRGDLAFRCNFATVDDDLLVTDRRAGRIKTGTDQLTAAVNAAAGEIDGVECRLKESVEHRAALVMRGEGLDAHVTDADPHVEDAGVLTVQATDEAAARTAEIVNRWVQLSHEALRDHPVNRERVAAGEPPANIVLPRGVGVAPHLKPFSEQYEMTGAMIVEVGLVQGLGEYLEMNVIRVPGATGGADTDEMALARAVVQAVDGHDFILCNLKAPDLAGHDGDARQKMAALAKLDRIARHLLDNTDLSRTLIIVAADHSTPVSVGDHTGDPVALTMVGHGVRPDHVTEYGERPCGGGTLGRITGPDLMNVTRNLIGAMGKFGA
jgi:2,3-bisphosphoglycerate-independent phosphoglycerate mutase